MNVVILVLLKIILTDGKVLGKTEFKPVNHMLAFFAIFFLNPFITQVTREKNLKSKLKLILDLCYYSGSWKGYKTTIFASYSITVYKLSGESIFEGIRQWLINDVHPK